MWFKDLQVLKQMQRGVVEPVSIISNCYIQHKRTYWRNLLYQWNENFHRVRLYLPLTIKKSAEAVPCESANMGDTKAMASIFLQLKAEPGEATLA